MLQAPWFNAKTLADVTTLEGVLDDYTDCHTRAEAMIEKTYYAIVGAGNRDKKAILTLADADGETHKWALPGFNGTPLQDKEGDYVDPVDMAVIQAGIEALTGESYTALRSPVIQTT